MGHGLHLAVLGLECGLDEALPVAGDAGARDGGVLGEVAADLGEHLDGAGHGVALVAAVVGVDDPLGIVDQGGLEGGGPGVDAEEAGAGGLGEVRLRDHVAIVALPEGAVLRIGGEQGAHPVGLRGAGGAERAVPERLERGGGLRGAGLGGACGPRGAAAGQWRRLGEECGADRHVELGPVWGGEGVHLAGQVAFEGRAQLGQEVQRPTQEHHVAADGAAAGEAGDGLLHHGGEDGGGEVLVVGAVVDEGLEVRFGEYSAARGDRVEGLVAGGELVQAGRVRVQQGGHLVDERAGPTGARAVHPLLGNGVEVGDLGVLAAELDDHVRVRIKAPDRGRLRDHLLHERQPERVGHGQATGSGDGPDHVRAGDQVGHLVQQAVELTGDVRVVAAVGLEADLEAVQQDELERGGADVQPQPQRCTHGISPPSRLPR